MQNHIKKKRPSRLEPEAPTIYKLPHPQKKSSFFTCTLYFVSLCLISSLCYFYLEEISQVLYTHTNCAAASSISPIYMKEELKKDLPLCGAHDP